MYPLFQEFLPYFFSKYLSLPTGDLRGIGEVVGFFGAFAGDEGFFGALAGDEGRFGAFADGLGVGFFVGIYFAAFPFAPV